MKRALAALVFALCAATAVAVAQDRRDDAGRFDYYLLSLSWSPSYCSTVGENSDEQCNRSDGKRFSDKVVYIYLKQLEEADVIVINKRDLIDAALLAQLDAALATRFPSATRFAVGARSGDGLEAWFRHITGAIQGAGTALTIDYDQYADGEALLGWFNATVAVCADDAADADGNRLVTTLMLAVQRRLAAAGAEIAHLKMTLAPDDGSGEIATSNLVRSGQAPELAQSLSDDIESAQLVINLRAEADPGLLREAVLAAISEQSAGNAGLALAVEHLESFRPGRPVPTHRFTDAGR